MVPEHLLTPRAGTRGRIVMLVDNGVTADSRVQKQARSTAEAGWDVVLVGRSGDADQHTWQLGGANIPGTTNTFGGDSAHEFGPLLFLDYPGTGFAPVHRTNDFRQVLETNPCPNEAT
jgi:hypothetical protein